MEHHFKTNEKFDKNNNDDYNKEKYENQIQSLE